MNTKQLLFLALAISLSLISFSQKRDTFNLFKKEQKKDALKEIQLHPQSKLDSVYYIKYGKIETKCTENCFHEATIDSVNMVTVTKSPLKTDNAKTTSTQWNMLVSSIEINSFFSIPEKIGNPGVGDENTEWVELNYAGKVHKITFDSTGPDEYEGIKNLLKLLKSVTGF